MSNPDRAPTWDANDAVDVLIGGGGAAVWVKREEVAPRAAIRHGSSDLVTSCMDLAALRIGVRRLEEATAHGSGVPLSELDGMIEQARKVIEERTETATRIRPSGEKQ